MDAISSRETLPLSKKKPLQVVIRSTRIEISHRVDFAPVLKRVVKVHSGANSLRFQHVTAI